MVVAMGMLLHVDEQDDRPIYLQIVRQIRDQIGNGTLKPGDELPPIRELADSLGINLHTVRSAYLKLREDGVITMRLGRRAKISKLPERTSESKRRDALQQRLNELITDALLEGIATDDIRELVDQRLHVVDENSKGASS
jgi:GntR family transcriptional regulator